MDKQDVLHIYNGVLLIPALNGIPLSRKKKEIMPFAATWMDLEIIILSEVKTEKDKYMINVENPPAMQETQVQSIGQEYPLEKGIATHSSIVVWRTS